MVKFLKRIYLCGFFGLGIVLFAYDSYAANCGPGYPIMPRSEMAGLVNGITDPKIFTLKTQQQKIVGEVTVTNTQEDNGKQWIMQYKVTDKDWHLAKIKLAVAESLSNIPHDQANQLDVNKFDYHFSFDQPKKDFSIDIPLDNEYISGNFADMCGQVVTFSSQVELVLMKNNQVVRREIAWIDGDQAHSIKKYAAMDFPCTPCVANAVLDVDENNTLGSF